MKMAQITGYYTVSEAAKILRRSAAMVRRYIQTGQISAKKAGFQHLIEQSEIHNFAPKPRGNPNFGKNLPSVNRNRAKTSETK